jgi:5-methylcytosine-specific restriction endonuclease McrA
MRRVQAQPKARPCVGDCGAVVVSSGPKVLCAACREVRIREHTRRKNHRRRMALYSVPSEPYTLAEIAERDGHRCQLCRRKVDMRLKTPHPLSPSIDHIVPLADGGDDTRANVQLAHRRCNTSKGVRGSQQLALVG